MSDTPNPFDKLKDNLVRELGSDSLAEKFLVRFRNEFTANARLRSADAPSVVSAALRAAQLRLDFNRGQCHFDVKKGQAKLVIDYRGLIALGVRSGDVDTIEARVVYEGETFNHILGLNPTIEHVPTLRTKRNPDDIIAAYAIARKAGREPVFVVIDKAEIGHRKSFSDSMKSERGREYSPWIKHTEEMVKKTAIISLLKYMGTQDDHLYSATYDADMEMAGVPVAETIVNEIEGKQDDGREERNQSE